MAAVSSTHLQALPCVLSPVVSHFFDYLQLKDGELEPGQTLLLMSGAGKDAGNKVKVQVSKDQVWACWVMSMGGSLCSNAAGAP